MQRPSKCDQKRCLWQRMNKNMKINRQETHFQWNLVFYISWKWSAPASLCKVAFQFCRCLHSIIWSSFSIILEIYDRILNMWEGESMLYMHARRCFLEFIIDDAFDEEKFQILQMRNIWLLLSFKYNTSWIFTVRCIKYAIASNHSFHCNFFWCFVSFSKFIALADITWDLLQQTINIKQ